MAHRRFYLVAVILVAVTLACRMQVPDQPHLVAVTNTTTATRTVVTTVTIESTATSSAWTAKVKLPTVNVRKEPGGKVIGNVTVGKVVTIVQCDGSWCQISAPVNGYIFRGCLSDNPESLGCEAK